MNHILEQLRIFSKIGIENLSYVDVGKIFDEAIRISGKKEGVEFVNNCKGLLIEADSLLRNVFFNLIDNSLKHGNIVSQIKLSFNDSGKYVKIIYQDNGKGMPVDIKKHLFEEGEGKNNGYGLFLIKSLCSSYGWNISEVGTSGKGSRLLHT